MSLRPPYTWISLVCNYSACLVLLADGCSCPLIGCWAHTILPHLTPDTRPRARVIRVRSQCPPPSPGVASAHQTPGPSSQTSSHQIQEIISRQKSVKRRVTWLIPCLWDDNEKVRYVNCIVAPSLSIKFQYPIQWSSPRNQSPWRTFWQESSKKHPLTPVRWYYSANWGGILSEVKNFFLKLVHNLSVTNMFGNLTKPSPYAKVLNKLLYMECKLRSWAKQTQHKTGKDSPRHDVFWQAVIGKQCIAEVSMLMIISGYAKLFNEY